MALPPWTVELLRRGVADLARQVTDNDTAASLKEQASKLVEELPKTAREKVDTILRQAEESTRPIKDVWQSGVLWGGGTVSLTPTRLINASGRLLDPRGSGVGIPAESLAAAVPHLAGDASHVENVNSRLCEQIAATITRRCNEGVSESRSLSAIVTNSLDASLGLIATLGKRGGSLNVPRCCAVPLDTVVQTSSQDSKPSQRDELLVERLRRFGCGNVREFGRVDGSDRWDDVHFAKQSGRRGGPPRHGQHGEHGGDKHRGARLQVLVRLAAKGDTGQIPGSQRENWIDVVVMPVGSIYSTGNEIATDSVVDQLRAGADIVVLAGGVLAGTPELGLIVGNEDVMERLVENPRHDLVVVPAALTAIVASSVAVQSLGRSPLGQLMGVSEENLQDRATRLATQLAGFDAVQSTRVTAAPASIGIAPGSDCTSQADDAIPSRQVVVTLDASKAADVVARNLADAPTGLLCGVAGNEIVIDLRWVSPEQQAQIGEIVGRGL